MGTGFYHQEKGLLIKPKNTPKWRISWSIDNILEGFKEFFRIHQRWPIGQDLDHCEYLPNVKTVHRKFGGIINIREKLGLSEVDYRIGIRRSNTSKEIGQRGYNAEQTLYMILLKKFYEPFVHNQSRVVLTNGSWVKVDFVVYHKHGKFAVDVFYPKADNIHYSNNIAIKYKTYINFPFTIYLVLANELITSEMLKLNETAAKNWRNKNAILFSYRAFIDKIGEYSALPNPYK